MDFLRKKNLVFNWIDFRTTKLEVKRNTQKSDLNNLTNKFKCNNILLRWRLIWIPFLSSLLKVDPIKSIKKGL